MLPNSHRHRRVRFYKRVHVNVILHHEGLWYNDQDYEKMLQREAAAVPNSSGDSAQRRGLHPLLRLDRRAVQAVLREQHVQQVQHAAEMDTDRLAKVSRQASLPCAQLARRAAMENEFVILSGGGGGKNNSSHRAKQRNKKNQQPPSPRRLQAKIIRDEASSPSSTRPLLQQYCIQTKLPVFDRMRYNYVPLGGGEDCF